jgi:hypothetical protein
VGYAITRSIDARLAVADLEHWREGRGPHVLMMKREDKAAPGTTLP